MKYYKFKQLQKYLGYDQMQHLIDTGAAWSMEGAVYRAAIDSLAIGACVLPASSRRNYYGGTVPSRYQVKPGVIGSYENAVRFYSKLI
jgi:hypothetical protein